MKNNKLYYFDSASTTRPYSEVIELNQKLLQEHYVNSDALYSSGIAIYRIQEKARELIADILKVVKEEIIFTSGASVSNNLAIKGICLNQLEGSRHIITSPYEHTSVLNCIEQMRDVFHFTVDILKLDANGRVCLEDLKEKLRKDTCLVSVMAINNEVGCINDIKALAEYTKKNSKAVFHSDITQAITKREIDLTYVDLASFSAHKFHGLKGSGVLMKKRHIKLLPLVSAGQQEFSIHGGTSNYIANICLAKALQLSMQKQKENQNKIKMLNHYLREKLENIPQIKIISKIDDLENILMVQTNVYSEVMMNALNEKNICVSSKSTCKTRDDKASPTSLALGYDSDYALRISIDEWIEKEDIDILCQELKGNCSRYGV